MKQRRAFVRSIIHENLSEEKHRGCHRDKRNKQQHHHRYCKRRGVLHVGFFLPFIGPTSMIQMKIKVTEAITTETKNKLSLNS
jgi:hypothetical protein